MCRFNSGVGVSLPFHLMIISANAFSEVFLPPRVVETVSILLEVSASLYQDSPSWFRCYAAGLSKSELKIITTIPTLIVWNRPEVKFFCNLDYDPFKFMAENNKVYGGSLPIRKRWVEWTFWYHFTGFTISLLEWSQTIPTLWQRVKGFFYFGWGFWSLPNEFEDFVGDHPQYLSKNNSLRFVSDDGGDSYNLCHCVYLIVFVWTTERKFFSTSLE